MRKEKQDFRQPLANLFLSVLAILPVLSIFDYIHSDWLLWSIILNLAFAYRQYLRKPSKYYLPDQHYRSWSDICILTSWIYLLLPIYYTILNEFHMSMLSLFTFSGSMLYHIHAEAAYFNFDNIFATSQALICLWTIIQAAIVRDYQFMLAGIAMAGFGGWLLKFTGMPSDIIGTDISNCFCRVENPHYRIAHSFWHVVSVLGPAISSFYISYLDKDHLDIWYHISVKVGSGNIPIVHAGTIMLAIVINFIGNSAGVMPLA